MGANLCCLGDSSRRLSASKKKKMQSLPKAQVHKELCKVTLEDLIAASPNLNIECKETTSYRVDIVSMSMETSSFSTNRNSEHRRRRKLTKKVSFRSPAVADILVLSPVIYA